MPYATATQFVAEFGLTETAQLLSDEQVEVVSADLQAVLDGGSLEDADTQAAVEKAIARLESMLTQSALLMDGYIGRLNPLPLSPEDIAAAPLMTCNLELARCQLMEDADNGTDHAKGRCARWLDWLADVAGGKVRITRPASTGSAPARYGRSQSEYNWSAYP